MSNKLDQVVAEARRAAERREKDYRAKALKLYPWVCGRCAREFTRENLRELTVHLGWRVLLVEASPHLAAGASPGHTRPAPASHR